MSTFDPTRRQLLKAAAWLPLASACGRLAFAGDGSAAKPAQASLVVHPERLGRTVSDSLTGFSYETQQLENPAFFSADNHALVRLFRELSPHARSLSRVCPRSTAGGVQAVRGTKCSATEFMQ